MDDLRNQSVEFVEEGMITLPDDNSPSYWPKNFVYGVPHRVEIYNNPRPSSAFLDRQVEGQVDDEDEDRREFITVEIGFVGEDDNERHGLRLSLTPELATVIAQAMLTHASSVMAGDFVNTTLIQGFNDYTAEKDQTRGHDRWW